MQLARYLSNTKHQNQKAYIKVMINPMKVWNSEAAKKNIGDFRQVRDVALQILSIQTSSVEPESLFSDLKFMVKARQTRMKPKNVNARICLKCWMAGLVDKSVSKPRANRKWFKEKWDLLIHVKWRNENSELACHFKRLSLIECVQPLSNDLWKLILLYLHYIG